MLSHCRTGLRLCCTYSGAGNRFLLSYHAQKLALKGKRAGRECMCYGSVSSGSEKLASKGDPDNSREAESEGGDIDLDRLIKLPPPKDVKIKTAKYVTSSVAMSQCPPPKLPEFAVIGRSNVGKSSLINMLTGSKSLALTSKQPGAHSLTAVAFRTLCKQEQLSLSCHVVQGKHGPSIISSSMTPGTW